jgi:hypothetical protein
LTQVVDFPVPDEPSERRRWLETLEAACERVLIRDVGDTTDRYYEQLHDDVRELLGRIRAELDAEA